MWYNDDMYKNKPLISVDIKFKDGEGCIHCIPYLIGYFDDPKREFENRLSKTLDQNWTKPPYTFISSSTDDVIVYRCKGCGEILLRDDGYKLSNYDGVEDINGSDLIIGDHAPPWRFCNKCVKGMKETNGFYSLIIPKELLWNEKY